MRTLVLVLLASALVFAPSARAGTEIASGDILVGAATTQVIGIAPVTSFYFAAPSGLTTISSVTTDHGGLGYDIDFYFYGAGGAYLGGCFTAGDPLDPFAGVEETNCAVPAGTTEIEVSAWSGADLHVSVQTP